MALEIPKAAEIPIMLQIVRHLYEGEGDKATLALAEYIRSNQVLISEEALQVLIASVKAVRM